MYAATLRAIRDAMETLNGSWKLSILLALKGGEQTEKQKETPNTSESIVRTKGIHLPRGIL